MTTPKLKDLDKIAREAERAILDAASLDALEEARRAYLGRRGLVAQLFDQVPSLPRPRGRKAAGQRKDSRDRLGERGARGGGALQGPGLGTGHAERAIEVPRPAR